jgi:glycosyltransferase involved in cell wall biosynthesis
VIYNGVEEPATVSTTLKRKIKSRLNLKENERVLFALQRLDPLKRVDVLIQSMPRILQRFPNTRLIIGGKGPEQTRLKNIANDLNVAEHVHFTGFITQNELPIYFTLADLFVFHSTYETFGMVLAEAMNFRKAIVSVSNTAISEVVDDGKTGLLVPTLDYEALADAVLKLLNDEERRNEMGRNGYKKSQKFFKWNAIASQYEKVLNLAINNESKLK